MEVQSWVRATAKGHLHMSKMVRSRKESPGGKSMQFELDGTGKKRWLRKVL